MDGVLVDYSSGWWDIAKKVGLRKLKGKDDDYTKEELAQVYKHTNTPRFWEELKWEHGGMDLFRKSNDLFEHVHILTSTAAKGNKEKHNIVALGKMHWIEGQLGHYMDMKNVHIVDEGVKKAEFANPLSILVDDRKSTIQAFNAAKGYGILHQASQYHRTIRELEDLATPLDLGEIAKRLPIVTRGFWNRK